MTLPVPILEGTYVVERSDARFPRLLRVEARDEAAPGGAELLLEDAITGDLEVRPEELVAATFELGRARRQLDEREDLARIMRTNRGCRPR